MRSTPQRPTQGPLPVHETPVPAAKLSKKAAAKEAARVRMAARRGRETSPEREERLRKMREHNAAERATESAAATRSRQLANRTRMAQSRAAESAEQTLERQENERRLKDQKRKES